jgi:PadR family transcriptional regulator, regulatory protein AphA
VDVTEPSLPASTYAVLGLVDKLPDSSGYDLAAVASVSFAYFWPLSRTLLYRELERLTGLGWVKPTRVEQSHAPNKWTYRATADGRRELTRWLRRPPGTAGSTRNPVLLRLFFAHRMSNAAVTSLLANYRAQLQIELDQLLAVIDKLEAIVTPAARSGRIVAQHGVATTRARLDWASEAQRQLTSGGDTRDGR